MVRRQQSVTAALARLPEVHDYFTIVGFGGNVTSGMAFVGLTPIDERERGVEDAKLALESRAAELSQANHYKSEFLANISHELRTPLNPVMAAAVSLAELDLEPEARVAADFLAERQVFRGVRGFGLGRRQLLQSQPDVSE